MQATSLSGLHWTNFLCQAVMRQFSVSLWVQGPVAVVFAPRITVDPTRAATGGARGFTHECRPRYHLILLATNPSGLLLTKFVNVSGRFAPMFQF